MEGQERRRAVCPDVPGDRSVGGVAGFLGGKVRSMSPGRRRKVVVFSVNYFCRLRQLFLPVHLLFLGPFLSHSCPVTGDVEFQDDRVVDHPVDGRRGCHWVGEDVLPLGEEQVGRDAQGATLVAFGDEREEHLGFLCTLGQVALAILLLSP